MSVRRAHLAIGAAALIWSMAASTASAQSCAKGRSEPALGIVVECRTCAVRKAGESPAPMTFSEPPVVVTVDRSARTSIPLRKGDVITAVDGEDIRTEKGARLFHVPPADRPVRLAVRRGASEIAVTVQPLKSCTGRH